MLTKIEFTEDAAQIVDLWHRVFGDDEAYIRFFLDNCRHKRCVGAFVGERLVSMLFCWTVPITDSRGLMCMR